MEVAGAVALVTEVAGLGEPDVIVKVVVLNFHWVVLPCM